MLTKIILNYLKGAGYTIVDAVLENPINAYNITTKIVITVNPDGRAIICYADTHDIRFKGKIENLSQLQMILKLIQ